MTTTRKPYDISFSSHDHERRARHGLPWTNAELKELELAFHEGNDLRKLCIKLQRPAEGVIAKLRQLDLIIFDVRECKNYYAVEPSVFASLTTSTPKEPTMANVKNIETKTFIQGEDAAQLSDEQIFKKISQIENEITKLNAIQAKPKKLVAVIEGMQADIAKLVEFVDAR